MGFLRMVGWVAALSCSIASAAGLVACAGASGEDAMGEELAGGKPLLAFQKECTGAEASCISDEQRRELIAKKSTCPFVGASLAMKKLYVYGSLVDPVAVIAGPPGGSSLAPAQRGSAVAAGGPGSLAQGFRIVARGNHNRSGAGVSAPEGMFSLDFPNSRGAHAAHSFILMGDPRTRDSGRLDETNLHRLIDEKSSGGHAEWADGKLVVRRSELGKFVARNVACDPNAVSLARTPFGLLTMLGGDIAEFTRTAAELALSKLAGQLTEEEKTRMLEDLLKIAVRNNLVGSAGEFGLLMTALGGSPNAVVLPSGERALAVADIEAIFAGKKVNGKYDPLTRTLPPNWDTTPRTMTQFLVDTLQILKVAGLANLADEYHRDATCPEMK